MVKMVQQEIEDLRWTDGCNVYTSWDSGISKEDTSDHLSRGSSIRTRATPLRDTSNYWRSLQSPSRTYKREQIITSYKCLQQEEEILGRKILHLDGEDNCGRNKVKRCKSERTATPQKIPRKVKRTYSVIHRYDPEVERVVTEYKCSDKAENLASSTSAHIYRYQSEPQLVKNKEKPKKAKRSFTTLLGMKLFNMLKIN